jgi:hypothetical protein
MPSPRLLGLNGLKLQFHSVPCSLEMVRVPLGALLPLGVLEVEPEVAPEVEPVEPVPEGVDDPEELQAAATVASSTVAPVRRMRLIGGVLLRRLVRVTRVAASSAASSPDVAFRRLYVGRSSYGSYGWDSCHISYIVRTVS